MPVAVRAGTEVVILAEALLRTRLRQLRRDRQTTPYRLTNFTTSTYPQYVMEPYHALVCAALDRVVAGETKRLMIFAFPQSGKSELVSVRLPAYWFGRRPDAPVILASYGAQLAETKSRQARNIVESTEYAGLFPGISTAHDTRSVQRWELAGHRGAMLAVGVGGPITGHGAMLGIIDDPVENWAQAQSLTMRDTAWDWWRTTFRTRIWENGAIVLIMTRWHEDDLAGRILAEQAERWEVLRLPALAETQEERDTNSKRLGLPTGQPDPLGRQPGEPLCPRRFSLEALLELRRDVGSMAWAAEYQGCPIAAEGNRFKRQWFTIVDASPAQAARVRYWDKAGVAGGGDYSAGVLMARSTDGVYYVEDVKHGQWSSYQRNQVMLQTAQLDADKHQNSARIWTEQEPGSGGKESAEATVRLLAAYPVRAETVTGSKEVRAEPLAAQCEAGNVRLVRGPWNAAFIDEMTAFPTGRYDDQIDATAGAFNKLARPPMREARVHGG